MCSSDLRWVHADAHAASGQLDQPVRSQLADVFAGKGGEDARRQREHPGCVLGRKLDIRGRQCVLEIGHQLVVGAWLDHDGDVRVGPTVPQAPDLPREAHARQEYEEAANQRRQDVAAEQLQDDGESRRTLTLRGTR